jgi:hypothetical protein
MLSVLVWWYVQSGQPKASYYFTDKEAQGLTDKQCVKVTFEFDKGE